MTESVPPGASPDKSAEREVARIAADRAAAARQVAEEAIANGKQREFLTQLDKFPDGIQFPKEVIPALVDYIRANGMPHLYWGISDNLRLFKDLDNATAALLLRADAGLAQSYFNDTPPRGILSDELAPARHADWKPFYTFFPPPNAEVAEAMIASGQVFQVGRHLNLFPEDEHAAIAEAVWKHDPTQITEPWKMFPYALLKHVPPGFAETLAERGAFEPLIVWLGEDAIPAGEVARAVELALPKADSDVQDTFRLADAITMQMGKGQLDAKKAGEGLSSLFPHMHAAFLGRTANGFYYPPHHTPLLLRYNRLMPPGVADATLDKLAREFGDDGVTSALYTGYELLENGTYDGPLFGAVRSGPPMGILRGEMEAVRRSVITGEPNKELLASPLHLHLFKSAVRFDQSSFGSHEDDELMKMADTYERAKSEGTIVPLDAAFRTFDLSVPLVREGKTTYTEDFKARWKTLLEDVRIAANIVGGEKQPLSYLADRVRYARNDALLALDVLVRDAERAGENPKKVEHLKKQRAAVEAVDVRSMRSVEQTFTALVRVRQAPGIEPLFRQIAFAYAFMRFPAEQVKDYGALEAKAEPSRADISQMLDFIDHLTNEEVWKGAKDGAKRPILAGKQARAAFDALLDTSALKDQFKRFALLETEERRVLRVVPERNFNTELSGHMSDACWASKYPSILAEFPNLTSLTLIQNPGEEFERIAGAALVIDGAAKDGTPLMIVRGINPIENVIQKLHAPSFLRGLLERLEEIAKARGRRLAVVVDNSGEASTNRPTVAEVLKQAIAQSTPPEQAKLADDPNTKFNGYELSTKTWYFEPKHIS
jgi:hypothetical protein